MKRVTFRLSPMLLLPDDVDPIDLMHQLTGAILDLNPLKIGTVEAVSVGRSESEPARAGTCRVEGHSFYAPHYFPATREVPDICPDHARIEHDADVREFHRPLFEQVTSLTGLKPLIWQSGGGTMTIVIPLTDPEPGTDWSAPCYMGLVEGHTDAGLWHGSVGYYLTDEQAQDGDEVTIVPGGDHPQHPHEWARKIAEHYQAHAIHDRPH